jgi:TRAP-type C4-dicarboxylate transport system permease small subunit
MAKFEKFLIVLLFSALISVIAFNVISRNLFQVSFQKILEFAPSIVLWLALTGSTLALKQHRHIKLELMIRYFPEKLRFIAGVAVTVFGISIMGILFLASLVFVKNEIEMFGGWGWLSLIFPFFFSVSAFRYFIWTLDRSNPQNKSTKNRF